MCRPPRAPSRNAPYSQWGGGAGQGWGRAGSTHCSLSTWHSGSRRPSHRSCRPASPSGLLLRYSSRRVGRQRSVAGRPLQPASVRPQFWRLWEQHAAVTGRHADRPRGSWVPACRPSLGSRAGAHLSVWILQVGPCRPWSSSCMPASPSSLLQRLSSVRVGLSPRAELMSLQRPSVMPQSISLRTGHSDGHVTWQAVTQKGAENEVGHNHDVVSEREKPTRPSWETC